MLYNEIILNDIKDHLKTKGETLSVAESVTSGHLQAAFSAAKEASLFFQGGITTYNLGQKCRHLNIEPIHAEKFNCISELVATKMALETNKLFLSHFGIGVTGYATKMPEQGVNSLFAYFSIAYMDQTILTRKVTSQKTESTDVQIDYASQVIEALFQFLRTRNNK